MRSRTSTVTYGDSYSLGQIGQMWEKPPSFVRQLVDEGKLQTDDHGLVTNEVLHDFYAKHGTLLYS